MNILKKIIIYFMIYLFFSQYFFFVYGQEEKKEKEKTENINLTAEISFSLANGLRNFPTLIPNFLTSALRESTSLNFLVPAIGYFYLLKGIEYMFNRFVLDRDEKRANASMPTRRIIITMLMLLINPKLDFHKGLNLFDITSTKQYSKNEILERIDSYSNKINLHTDEIIDNNDSKAIRELKSNNNKYKAEQKEIFRNLKENFMKDK